MAKGIPDVLEDRLVGGVVVVSMPHVEPQQHP